MDYSSNLKRRVEAIPGARFVPEHKGGPGFSIQKDMQTCMELRRTFKQQVTFSPEIVEWGKLQRAEEARLVELSSSMVSHDDLSHLWSKLEGRTVEDHETGEDRLITELFREDQKIGVSFWSECPNPLIADEPGLGKTWEVIAGILQHDQELTGCNLVVCPKLSIESVWLEELNAFQDEVVFVAPEGRRQREKLLKEVAMCQEDGIPFWLVVNPAMVGLRRVKKQSDTTIYDHATGEYLDVQFPFLFDTEWNNIIIDEAHLSGLGNPSSQFSKAIRMMKCRKRTAMTGTPAGGKPLRLWGILNWLEPAHFNAKHTWAKRWLKSFEFEAASGQEITEYRDLKNSLEEEFYREHRRYILRRRKVDVFKGRNKPHPVDVWVHMTEAQEQQYGLMEEESIANIYESEQQIGRVSIPNLLAQSTWLKQFAFGYCDLVERDRKWDDFLDAWVIKYKAVPTLDSPKLEAIWAKIQEIGCDDPGTGEQVVIFTQFRATADLITDWLRSQPVQGSKTEKLKVAKITGDVGRRAERQSIIKDFQSGGVYQAIVMTSKAGGVSINLDRANNVIHIDEDWDPDVKTQATNRVDRASRDHVVTVTTIRTRGTIEEDIQKKLKKKQKMNDILLDRYRAMVKERGEL